MSIGGRIFIACLAVSCACLLYPLYRLADTVATHYREGVEDSLTDQANILASLIEAEIARHQFSPQNWQALFARVHNRELAARIYDLDKERVDSHLTITDNKGIVLFDSENPENIGKDFSAWRDVALTLAGRYGARTTRIDRADETTSRLHVAAPIVVDGAIWGVLTVVKPTTNIRYFVSGAKLEIAESGLIAFIIAGLFSLAATTWITRPIKTLTGYARGIRDGLSPAFPRLADNEIGEMGRALAEMQRALEGRRYVEQYVQHLTHELKSPLSAIRGAAELLADESAGKAMPPERRARFIANIDGQSRRIQAIVDRMLELAALENRFCLENREPVSISALIHTVCESFEPLLTAGDYSVAVDPGEGLTVSGDGFLMHQATVNLVQNALDFSPPGGCITLRAFRQTVRQAHWKGTEIVLEVADQGPGIPPYASEKIFDKFFSLPRTSTGQKSTGLGLNFVRQVAIMHGGRVSLENLPEGGALARLILPE
ncbi:MAG: two-component system sensor histidine kinase CreC [Desulfobulbus sp.]|jgi:two-component system sensor histidine kinase CreC|uniref:two-component system sensor histidine kinase CreC n=1 Tax=Desulfobulbus sp. TaxID=895 RepID=UPI00284F3223|nr:two-component system sensor histidine kinase CreC [Desulfobulbus sp.]MDR2549173.1 two-component system sensor histidine kinase CreC [Desulfobulbus sp.]